MNDNDFTPRTQEIISNIAQAILVIVIFFAVWSLDHPAPWSPLGQEQVTTPKLSAPVKPSGSMFNPEARLDNSRVTDRG